MNKTKWYRVLFLLSFSFLASTSHAQETKNLSELTATYPYGKDSLMNFIYTNLKWPDPMFCGEGHVIIKVTIDERGIPTEYEVLRGIAKVANEEALSVLKLIEKWNPQTENGNPICGQVLIPVKFILR